MRDTRREDTSLRALLDALPDGIVVHTGDRLLYANSALARFLGYERSDELLAVPLLELLRRHVHPEDSSEPDAWLWLRTVPDEHLPPLTESRGRRMDGSTFVAEVTTVPFPFDGQPALVAIVRDVTERRQMETRLLLADRLASVGRLAAGVAHEINNPLAYVTANVGFSLDQISQLFDEIAAPAAGSAEATLSRVSSRLEELRDLLEEAQDGANRVRQIVRDLRTFARSEERAGAIDVRRVLESTVNMAWNEIRHRARLVKLYAEVPRVLANESRLGQVFLNLLLNAAQAIPEGNADENEIRISVGHDGSDRVTVEVRDSGVGIPSENLSRVFEPFFTTKPVGVGTGLGLAIVHGIVTSLGGDITVESEVGIGTTFRVSLPAAKQATRTTELPAMPPAAKRARILLVDDEPLVLKAVQRMLSSEHDVTTANECREVLERLKGGERFDAILCDVMMPEMTGMDLFAELQKNHPDQAARMIFLTGGAFTPRAQRFLEQGRRWLEKPVEIQALREALKTVVGTGVYRAVR